MSELKIFDENAADQPLGHWVEHGQIADELKKIGVRFEQWDATQSVSGSDSHASIIAAYQHDIDRLITSEGYQAVDVMGLTPDHPDKEALRKKFLSEHTHCDDEVRFFVAGQGLFSLHPNERVYEVLCEQGDLISVPANTPHWFDMGPNPAFVAIRLYDDPAGWVANYTGSAIGDSFSRLDN